MHNNSPLSLPQGLPEFLDWWTNPDHPNPARDLLLGYLKDLLEVERALCLKSDPLKSPGDILRAQGRAEMLEKLIGKRLYEDVKTHTENKWKKSL